MNKPAAVNDIDEALLAYHQAYNAVRKMIPDHFIDEVFTPLGITEEEMQLMSIKLKIAQLRTDKP